MAATFYGGAWRRARSGLACMACRDGEGSAVFKCLNVSSGIAALWLATGSAAGEATPAVTVFATPEQCGQVLALTTDDAGRLFAAVTERAFGRGTVSALGNPVLAVQDRALHSIAAREQLVTGWLGSGKLAPLLKLRAAFYQSAGDGAPDFLTKYSESVCWLTDVNRDGKAEASMVVAGAFRDAMDGPGSALLALPNGRWFYGCPPNLWRLEDRNDDQRAEERTPVAEGFGLRNDPWGADLHSLLEAPDGWIYWTMGERGYAIREAGGAMVRGLGSGAIFRCRADGSGLERVARGLRNPAALAMKANGQLLAVDGAAPGGKSRLLHILPGADYGWQAESVSAPREGLWFAEGMESATPRRAPSTDHPQWMLPALTTLDGPWSALEILPDGTLLAGEPHSDGSGGISAWTLGEDGSSYQIRRGRWLWQGGAVVAVTQSPDGSLYFADWGDQFDAAGRCRIRRLTWPEPPASSSKPVVETETAMQAMQRLPHLTVRELKGFLEHASPRVALRARQRLEGMSFQDSLEALLQVARRGGTLPARLHGLRGAGAVARQDPALLNELTAFLSDPEPAIRATAATLLGEGNLTHIPPALRRALLDEARPVRLAAAAALARLKPPEILTDLLEAVARNTERDPFIRSSLAHALAEGVPAVALTEAAVMHDSAEVRLTAVLALRRMHAPEIADFLSDSDDVTGTEAARAIYDLPLRPVFARLAALLDGAGRPEPVQRRALAAAVYLGTPADAVRVAGFAVRPDTALPLRSAALTALETWDQPPLTDPLWQRQETVLPRLPGTARAASLTAADALRNHPDPVTAAQAGKLWKASAPLAPAARLATVNNPQASEPDRQAALLSLIATNELSTDAAKALTSPANPPIPGVLRAEARSLLMRRDPKNAVLYLSDALTTGSVGEKQAALQVLDRLPGSDHEKVMLELAKRLGLGDIERGLQVEVLEALHRRDTETRSTWRRATEAWLASLSVNVDPLAAWRMTMEHGDAAAGRVIFEMHPEAGCLSCHSTNGIGGVKGPDLDGVADRLTTGGLLESLIRPSAKIVSNYGTLAAMPPQEGNPEEAAASIMPPMGTLLTLRELRDLMAYLRTLKAL